MPLNTPIEPQKIQNNIDQLKKMEPRQPTRYAFTKASCLQLADLITTEYNSLQPRPASSPDSLKQMLMYILLAKDQELKKERFNWRNEMEKLAQRAYLTYDQHIQHADEREIDALANKDLKIVNRLIHLKNQKHQKLEHLKLEYNRLLEYVNKLLQEKAGLQKSLATLTDQNKRHLIEITKLKGEREKLNKLLDKQEQNLKTFQLEVQKIKQMYGETKQIITKTYTEVQQKFSNTIQKLIEKYGLFIGELKEGLVLLYREKRAVEGKLEADVLDLRRTVKELIIDLSQAIGFRRREDQVDEAWLASYRLHKGVKEQAARLEQGRSGVELPARQPDTSEFIRVQKEKLRRYRLNLNS